MTRIRKFLIALAALALVGAGAAFGQSGTTGSGYRLITSITGLELVSLVNSGPYNAAVQTNTLRNSTGYLLTASTSGTLTMTAATNNLIFTGAATTVTVNLPPSPSDGALFALNNGTGSNFSGTITVATTDGSTISNGSTAVNLGTAGSQEWQYTAAAKIWYRLR